MSDWGIQRLGYQPVIVGASGGADVACAAGSDTTVITPAAALIAPFQGVWSYYVQVFCIVVLGATAPSAMVFKLKNAGGTALDTVTINAAILTNAAILSLAFPFIGTSSGSAYFPSGDTPLITCNPTGQAVTFKNNSRAVFEFNYVGD